MISIGRAVRRARSFLTLRHRDRELDEELRLHVEMEADALARSGLDERAAREQAARRFGGIARHRDAARDARGIRAAEDFVSDVRVGLRALARQRAFTTVAVLTLGIGVGGTTAVFGTVYGILLAPLPYGDAGRIVTLWERDARARSERLEVSPGNFLDWRERARSFDGIAAAEPWSVDYIGREGPERFDAALVTAGYFDILRVQPLLGRTFRPEEHAQGQSQVVVLSERLWRSRFGADSSLVGRTLVLDSIPMTVIGVLPQAVEIPYAPDSWLPKVVRPDEREDRRSAYWTVIARLTPSATLDGGQAEMIALGQALAREYPSTNEHIGVTVVPLREALTGGASKGLWILFGAVGLVLVIACANVASLQLTQAVRRRREIAIRTAIGAGRGRIVRQLFAENVLLAAFGGVLGIAVAYWGIAGIRTIAPVDLPRVEELGVNGAVIGFALAATIATALAFGFAPVIEAGRVRLTESLGASGRTAGGARWTRRVNGVLVTAQLALALVLLVGAGLLVRSFQALLSVDRGFETHGVLATTMQTWSYYPVAAARIEYARASTARLRELPGVDASAMASSLPLTVPIGQERTAVTVPGEASTRPGEALPAHVTAVSAGFFTVLQIPLREGRVLDERDREGSAPVVVVNESFARRQWPAGSAIGRRIRFAYMGPPVDREIVGVVGDVRHDGLAADPRPSVFVPHAHGPTGAMHLLVRTSGDPRTLEPAVRRALLELNGAMPVSETATLDEQLASSLRERRFHLALLTAFACVAVLLSIVGVYGLISNATAARTHEIGVRVAIGASAATVVRLVLRQGAMLAVAGISVGVTVSLATVGLLRGMLFNVAPLDLPTFAVAVLTLLGASLVACWVPARRAAATDPARVLRQD